MTIEIPENYKEIKDAVEDLGKAAETIRSRQGLSSWVQLGVAVMTAAVAVISGLNNIALERVKRTQDDIQAEQSKLHQAIAERQVDENISTTVLHETMTILDTQDPNVRRQKVKMHRLLLTTLVQQSSGSTDDANSMRSFYVNLLDTLPSALNDPSESQELSSFINSDVGTATKTAAASAAATNAPPPPAPAAGAAVAPGPASPAALISPAGEAVQLGDPKGWDLDVFWCVRDATFPNTNANEVLAAKLFQHLVDRQVASKLGRIRLRRLPEIINQSPGYNIKNDAITIRATGEKQAMAATLQSWLNQDLGSPHAQTPVKIEQAHNKLPFYIPIYVCTAS